MSGCPHNRQSNEVCTPSLYSWIDDVHMADQELRAIIENTIVPKLNEQVRTRYLLDRNWIEIIEPEVHKRIINTALDMTDRLYDQIKGSFMGNHFTKIEGIEGWKLRVINEGGIYMPLNYVISNAVALLDDAFVENQIGLDSLMDWLREFVQNQFDDNDEGKPSFVKRVKEKGAIRNFCRGKSLVISYIYFVAANYTLTKAGYYDEEYFIPLQLSPEAIRTGYSDVLRKIMEVNVES